MHREKAFPSGIIKGQWEIIEGLGQVNMADKELQIPYTNTIQAQHIKNHEYCHIKYSPYKISNESVTAVEVTSIGAFEDCRVNILGDKIGVELSGVMDDVMVEAFGKIESRFLKLLYVIASFKYALHENVKSKLMPIEINIVEAYIEKVQNNVTNYDAVKNIAIEFAKMFSPETSSDLRKKITSIADTIKKPDDKLIPPSKPEPEESGDYIEEVVEDLDSADSLAFTESGKMLINKNPLLNRNVWRKKKRSDTGYILKRPERIITDMQCFDINRRAPFKGTILIDCSGSMALRPEDIEKLVIAGCGCTIAGYSGNRQSGKLEILSMNGNMVNKIPRFMGGNIIDFPALLWLSKQRHNKLWVSDGRVTGIFDRYDKVIEKQCFNLVKKHNISNVRNITDAIKSIDKLKKRV